MFRLILYPVLIIYIGGQMFLEYWLLTVGAVLAWPQRAGILMLIILETLLLTSKEIEWLVKFLERRWKRDS